MKDALANLSESRARGPRPSPCRTRRTKRTSRCPAPRRARPRRSAGTRSTPVAAPDAGRERSSACRTPRNHATGTSKDLRRRVFPYGWVERDAGVELAQKAGERRIAPGRRPRRRLPTWPKEGSSVANATDGRKASNATDATNSTKAARGTKRPLGCEEDERRGRSPRSRPSAARAPSLRKRPPTAPARPSPRSPPPRLRRPEGRP